MAVHLTRAGIMMSGRFDGQEKEELIRGVADNLAARGVDVKIVSAAPGQSYGVQTMRALAEANAMVAFCYENYGEKTESPYSTFAEVKYCIDNQAHISVIPLKLYRGDWPPTPCEDSAYQNPFLFTRDLVYIDCSDHPFDVQKVADKLYGRVAALEPRQREPPTQTDINGIDRVVGMYAGGEDDRPGGGPPPTGHSSAKASFAHQTLLGRQPVGSCRRKKQCYTEREIWEPDVDDVHRESVRACHLEDWYREVGDCSCASERDALIGRVGPLQLRHEVVVQIRPEDQASCPLCLVTQCSLDRLDRLEAQLVAWDGDVSAAVYLDADPGTEAAREGIEAIAATVDRARGVRAVERNGDACRVNVPRWHISSVYRLENGEVTCPYDTLYPVNALRNIALDNAKSDLVLLLDVDFVPSIGLYDQLCGGEACARLSKTLRGGSFSSAAFPTHSPCALVIPAFESQNPDMPLPRQGIALRNAACIGDVEGFHVGHFPQGHRATNFDRWLACGAEPSKHAALSQEQDGIDAYAVDYEEYFEPYVAGARELVPRYDERFRGYGLNKISHLYAMNMCGFSFAVANHFDIFVIANRHPKSESWQLTYGRNADTYQRGRIAVHYANFKAELHAAKTYAKLVQPSAKDSAAETWPPGAIAERNMLSLPRCGANVEIMSSTAGIAA